MHAVHCFIVRGPGGTFVRRWSPDTRLNGQPFRDAALHAGDRLSLGPVELEVVEGTPATPTASPASDELAATALQLAEQQRELDRLREQLQQSVEREQHGAERAK